MKPDHKPDLPHPPSARANKILMAVIAVLLAIIALMLLRPQLPAPPGPPHPGPERPPGPERLKTAVGKVLSYKYNMHMDINSMQISFAQAGILTIDFRPHTARSVMGIGGLGQMVTVEYNTKPNDETVGYQLRKIVNDRTGKAFKLDDLPPPPDIPDHAAENFKLNNPELITDQYGGIVALKKNDLLFHFKPGLVDDILPLIKNNHNFNLMAVKRDEDLGFVNVNNDKVYIVLNITINNQTFLVR